MIPIAFEDQLLRMNPEIRLGCLLCEVLVQPSNQRILELSNNIVAEVRSALTIDKVSQRPAIKSTKEAYRRIGKDPSRYRPSAEALARRIVNGKELYEINNVVDVLNLISLQSGFSIGGYDLDKIEGDIEFGIGKPQEPYLAIGRGDLNIENLPLFRDRTGAFGSPTSDSVRTMVTPDTKNFLMVIIDFDNNKQLEPTLEKSHQMYRDYVSASNIENQILLPIVK